MLVLAQWWNPASWLDAAVEWFIVKVAVAVELVVTAVLTTATLDMDLVQGPFGVGLGAGTWVLLAITLIAIISHALRAQPGRIALLLGVEVPLTLVAMRLIPELTDRLVAAANGLTLDFVGSANGDLRDALGAMLTQAAVGDMSLLMAVGAVFMLLGGIVTYAVLLVRMVVIGVSVLLGPMLLATRVWDRGRQLAGRWIILTLGVILVQPAIGAMWALGWSLFGGALDAAGSGSADTGQMVSAMLAGVGILLLGGAAPLAIMKLVPELGDQAASHLQPATATAGMQMRSAGRSAMRMVGGVAGRMGGTGGGVAGAGGGAGGGVAGGQGGFGGAGGGQGGGGRPRGVPVGAYGPRAAGGGSSGTGDAGRSQRDADKERT